MQKRLKKCSCYVKRPFFCVLERGKIVTHCALHRYVFLMYRQEEQMDQVAAYEDARRGKFNVAEFAKRYNLGNPVAMTYFHAERPGGSLKRISSVKNT